MMCLMMKLALVIAAFASMSFSATIVSSAEEDCNRPFVQDTFFPPKLSNEHSLYFCKDYGETLGVAAVKLELSEIAASPHLSIDINFYWKWGNPYYRSASAGAVPGKAYPNLNGYYYTRGNISAGKSMAYSEKDADQLEVLVQLDFLAGTFSDTASLPAIGDTLHWALSFIYFHSSKMSIWYWNNDGTPDAWKGSDTMTVRYRTIMQEPYPSEGLAGRRQGSPDGPVLGRYDLQGRPLSAQAQPSGLVFERTKQGFRKRLQLR